MTPARWATSTGPDELTARSTSGSALERSHRTHHQVDAAAAATRPSTLGEVQPQLEPFVMPSSSTNSVLASTTAPGRSKRAGNLVAAPRVLATTASEGEHAEAARHPEHRLPPVGRRARCPSRPARARRRARRRRRSRPPRLGSGDGPGARRGRSRTTAGSRPSRCPASARPATTTSSEPATAASTDPAKAAPRQPSKSVRLPYMSPIRPTTGFTAAPTTSVEVATQDTAAMSVSNATGRAARSAIELVCISAMTATAKATDPVTRSDRPDQPVASVPARATAAIRQAPARRRRRRRGRRRRAAPRRRRWPVPVRASWLRR